MPDYDGRIVIDSHIDTTRFDLDASKLFNKAKKLSDKLSISIKTKGIDLGFNINAIDNIIPKNMDKRIAEMAKYAADLGKPTLLSDIPSKFDDISNSARKASKFLLLTQTKAPKFQFGGFAINNYFRISTVPLLPFTRTFCPF